MLDVTSKADFTISAYTQQRHDTSLYWDEFNPNNPETYELVFIFPLGLSNRTYGANIRFDWEFRCIRGLLSDARLYCYYMRSYEDTNPQNALSDQVQDVPYYQFKDNLDEPDGIEETIEITGDASPEWEGEVYFCVKLFFYHWSESVLLHTYESVINFTYDGSDVNFAHLAESTILSQYSGTIEDNGTTRENHIQQLVRHFRGLFSPVKGIDEFYYNIFNPLTARGVGLNIWGRIVGIPRELDVKALNKYFGFEGSDLVQFGITEEEYQQRYPAGTWDNDYAPFYNVERAVHTIKLEDEIYRRLIMFKAASNIARDDLGTLKKLLGDVFATTCYVLELEALMPMKVRIIFGFYPSDTEVAILDNYGIMPLSAGVDYEIQYYPWLTTFGFLNSGAQPWNCGTFINKDSE